MGYHKALSTNLQNCEHLNFASCRRCSLAFKLSWCFEVGFSHTSHLPSIRLMNVLFLNPNSLWSTNWVRMWRPSGQLLRRHDRTRPRTQMLTALRRTLTGSGNDGSLAACRLAVVLKIYPKRSARMPKSCLNFRALFSFRKMSLKLQVAFKM